MQLYDDAVFLMGGEEGAGFRVQGSGYKAQGARLKVQGLRFMRAYELLHLWQVVFVNLFGIR